MIKDIASVCANFCYAAKSLWNGHYKALLINCFLAIPLFLLQPFLNILLPAMILNQITEQAQGLSHFLAAIGGLLLLIVTVGAWKGYVEGDATVYIGSANVDIFTSKIRSKLMEVHYELLEDKRFNDSVNRAKQACVHNFTPGMIFLSSGVQLMVALLGLMLYSSIIVSINPYMMLLLAAGAAINWAAVKKYQRYEREKRDALAKGGQRLMALSRIMGDPAYAKDIRLYSLYDLLKKLKNELLSAYGNDRDGVEMALYKTKRMDFLVVLLRDMVAYIFLINEYVSGRITIGEFALAFSSISIFVAQISSIIRYVSDVLRGNQQMSDLRNFLERQDEIKAAGSSAVRKLDEPVAIEVNNVSFQYSSSAKENISHLSVHIKPGEKIAIVGKNGAGKTTLVKLICGLYTPKSGNIKLNGHDQRDFETADLYRQFSVVFQDFHLVGASIAQNISQKSEDETDFDRVDQCLKQVGLYDKVQALENKTHSLLVRSIHDNAVELSGGEMQKLALARALYKNAPIYILDEPTAALDPIAESQIYQSFAEMTKHKTTLFISHRLASTRFCDRILYLENGEILEAGTHDELLALKGAYAALFEVQRNYYRSEVMTHA